MTPWWKSISSRTANYCLTRIRTVAGACCAGQHGACDRGQTRKTALHKRLFTERLVPRSVPGSNNANPRCAFEVPGTCASEWTSRCKNRSVRQQLAFGRSAVKNHLIHLGVAHVRLVRAISKAVVTGFQVLEPSPCIAECTYRFVEKILWQSSETARTEN